MKNKLSLDTPGPISLQANIKEARKARLSHLKIDSLALKKEIAKVAQHQYKLLQKIEETRRNRSSRIELPKNYRKVSKRLKAGIKSSLEYRSDERVHFPKLDRLPVNRYGKKPAVETYKLYNRLDKSGSRIRNLADLSGNTPKTKLKRDYYY